MSMGTSFVKIWLVCSCEFKPNFLIFWCLYHLFFDLKTIGAGLVKSSSDGLYLRKSHFNFGGKFEFRSYIVILLQMYLNHRIHQPISKPRIRIFTKFWPIKTSIFVFVRNNLMVKQFVKIQDSEFLKLVVGSSEQDTYFKNNTLKKRFGNT